MENDNKKPSPEAKALSLFLMAYKTKDPIYKEKSKRINRRFVMVSLGKITKAEYSKEVEEMLTEYGGYTAVVEKTVQYYIDKTGEWTLAGDDKYCQDAKAVAKKLLNK
jgi:hypothetical protein